MSNNLDQARDSVSSDESESIRQIPLVSEDVIAPLSRLNTLKDLDTYSIIDGTGHHQDLENNIGGVGRDNDNDDSNSKRNTLQDVELDEDLTTEEEDKTSQNKFNDSGVPDKFSGPGLLAIIAVFFFNICSWGANSGYSIYLSYYLNSSLFPDVAKVDFGIIGGLNFGSGLIFGPFVNYLVGIIGLKITMLIGFFFQFVGLLLASFATKLWHVYVCQAVVPGIGLALICIPNINIIPQWFQKRRSIATGITAAGSGVGGIIFNTGMNEILEKYSFRWSLRAQAIICLVVNICALLIFRTRNKDIKPVFNIYDKLVWLNFGVITTVLFVIFTMLGYVTLMYNLSDFTISLGYSQQQGATVSMMVSIGIIFGRPIIGRLSDMYGPINVTMIASFVVGIFALGMWIPCRNYATALIFACIEGSLMGSIWVNEAAIVVSITNLKKMGIAMALLWIIVGISGFVSPIIGIELKSGLVNGERSPLQYLHPAIFDGCFYIGAGLALFVLRGWIIARNEILEQEGEKLLKENNDPANLKLLITVPPKRAIEKMFSLKTCSIRI